MSALSFIGGGIGANGNINGFVPGGGMGRSVSTNTSSPGVIPGMMDIYNDTLNRNQANYNNILGTYSGGQNRLQSALPDIYKGYGDVLASTGDILGYGGRQWGVAAPAFFAMQREAERAQGKTEQDMIQRGLGNSSILANLTNQNAYNAQQSYLGLGAQLAQTYAGYNTQIGMADLSAKMQGLGMQTDLAKAQGSTLGGYHWQMPGPLTGQFSSGTSLGATQGGLGGSSAMGAGPRGGSYRSPSDLSPYGGDTYNPYTSTVGNASGAMPGQISAAAGQAAADQMRYGGSSYGSVPVNPLLGTTGGISGPQTYGDFIGSQIGQASDIARGLSGLGDTTNAVGSIDFGE